MDDITEYQKELFFGLILNFQMSAMINLGKIANPVTQTVERNLTEAKRVIDMMNMLAAKTKGNLTDEEDRFLQQVLTELRLNYVNEVSKPDPEEEKEEFKPEEGEKTEPDMEKPEEDVKTEKKSKAKPKAKTTAKKKTKKKD